MNIPLAKTIFVSIPGAMLAICDVNEYRKCVKEFGILFVSQLFDTLHALCNLLVVVPDNLKQVCTGEQLVSPVTSPEHPAPQQSHCVGEPSQKI